jgi:hypothetical protein
VVTPAETLRRAQAKAKRDALEDAMALQLRAAGLDAGMVRQWRPFCEVAYRFDFAWPDRRPIVVLEVEGGIWSNGAHARGSGIMRDIDKGNRANLAGMMMIRAAGEHVKTGLALKWVESALRAVGGLGGAG